MTRIASTRVVDEVIAGLATSSFRPEATAGSDVLVCLPGGTYTRRYFDLQVEGYPGYSFAEHMVSQGFVVVALDSLGTGDSRRPEREVGLADQAAAAAGVVEELRRRRLGARYFAVGHSMGGYVAMVQQAQARSYDGLAILGTTNRFVAPLGLPQAMIDAAARGADARAALVEQIAAGMPERSIPPDRSPLLSWFHASDVPAAVVDADSATTSTVVPRRAAAESSVPGITLGHAAAIDVPVFLGYGEIDVSPDPHDEVSAFAASPDVTLYRLAHAAHCHNMAGTRHRLWNRLAGWCRAVDRPEG